MYCYSIRCNHFTLRAFMCFRVKDSYFLANKRTISSLVRYRPFFVWATIYSYYLFQSSKNITFFHIFKWFETHCNIPKQRFIDTFLPKRKNAISTSTSFNQYSHSSIFFLKVFDMVIEYNHVYEIPKDSD